MKKSWGYILNSGKNNKIAYFIRQFTKCSIPRWLLNKRLDRIIERDSKRYSAEEIEERVSYYCKLLSHKALPADAERLGDFKLKGNGSAYYFDSQEIVRWFDKDLKWCHLFGDVTHVPPYPTIVKSRPIAGDNANSVVLNLDKCRHFVFLHDKIPFREKTDRTIFRGSVKGNAQRTLFMERFKGNPRIDTADTYAGPTDQQVITKDLQPQITLYAHLKYKFIMAIEGNDVASNLKWIMSSSSLAVMPKPTYETWFMEGRLKADYHYVEVKPDFSDLEEKMDYYISNPDKAEEIIRNANNYIAQFKDWRKERLVALLTMRRYFEMTGQKL